MAYLPGDSDIAINAYYVYLRTHRTAETVDHVNELKALVWDHTIGAIDINVVGDISTYNTIYGVDPDGGNVVIDLAGLAGMSDGDILIFYLADATGAFTVDIEDGGIPGEGILWAVDAAAGVAVAFVYVIGTTHWEIYTHLNDTGAQEREYTLIGECEEKASIKTSVGETKKFSSLEEKDISEVLEFGAKDLQVNSANSTFLRDTLAGINIDVIFYQKTENTVYPTKTIRLIDIPFNTLLTITGNDVNFNEVVSNKTVPNVDDYMKMGLD